MNSKDQKERKGGKECDKDGGFCRVRRIWVT